MSKPRCPSCKRDSTYNAKYDQCSGCGRGYEKVVLTTTGTPDEAFKAIDTILENAKPKLASGEPCPTCGKPVGKTAAQLQKEYRERKANR